MLVGRHMSSRPCASPNSAPRSSGNPSSISQPVGRASSVAMSCPTTAPMETTAHRNAMMPCAPQGGARCAISVRDPSGGVSRLEPVRGMLGPCDRLTKSTAVRLEAKWLEPKWIRIYIYMYIYIYICLYAHVSSLCLQLSIEGNHGAVMHAHMC